MHYKKSTVISITGLLTTLLLASCSDDDNQPKEITHTEITTGKLVPVKNAEEMAFYVKKGLLETYTSDKNTPVALPAESDKNDINLSGSSQFSSTYTLESRVDEADTVKYNGRYLFALTNSTPQIDAKGGIRVMETIPGSADINEIAILSPERHQDLSFSSLYLHNQTLMSIAATATVNFCGTSWLNTRAWQGQYTDLSFYNLEDMNNINERWQASIQGNLVSSRRIDNTLYLITRHTPQVDGLAYAEEGSDTEQANITRLNNTPLQNLIPSITTKKGKKPLFSATDCYLGNTDTHKGYSVITAVTAIDINNPENIKSMCYNGKTNGVYVAPESIYLTYDDWQEQQTWVHKFSLDNLSIDYRGTGSAEGLLNGRLDADFYLSEHNGDLRMVTSLWRYATTTGGVTNDIMPPRSIDHRLTLLRDVDNSHVLEKIATLPNKMRQDTLGKPNESLYGVRFFGDKAYIVTYETKDPLYIIDLSNPEDPFIAGELEVPGFSDFLHPISDNLLLGIGKNAEGGIVDGLKIELFDISYSDRPISRSVISIGEQGTRTQAVSNRHALTYLPISSQQHRFALPIDRYTVNDDVGRRWGQWQDSGLYMFEINNVDNPDTAYLTVTGKLINAVRHSDNTPNYPEYTQKRSVLDADAVYYLSNGQVWSTFWSAPDVQFGPL